MFDYSVVSIIYVAPSANGSGLYPQPESACSLNHALQIIQELRGAHLMQPITIKFHAGEYYFDKTISLVPPLSNVTFEPFGDGDVFFYGARKITDFRKTEFNGTPCFGAYIDDVKNGKLWFTDLYVDGLRADFTRYPENGYLLMKDSEIPHATVHSQGSHWFIAADNDMEKLRSLYAFNDCFISFNHYWIDEHTPVTSLDKETGKVTMSYKSRSEIHEGQEYIIENVAEMFSKPNQWYLDRQTGMLYYIPRNAEMTPESISVFAPVISKFFRIEGYENQRVSGIRFRDITFACTKGDYGSGSPEEPYASDCQSVCSADGIISLQFAENCGFDHCTFRNYGLHGINISYGSRNIKIEYCTFFDAGGGGIRINGTNYYDNKKDWETYGNTVSDCVIKRVGRRYLSSCGILSMNSYENDFIHNEISDLFYTGISCGWVWGYTKSVSRNNRILDNHIFNVGQGLLSDMGGIYLLGTQEGTIVRGNKIHDIKCKQYGGWALYTDEGSTGMTLEYNLCYNTSSNSYHQHYGAANVVRNNIFALSDSPLMHITRLESHMSILFINNIYYSKGTPILQEYREPTSFYTGRNLLFSKNDFMYCKNGWDGEIKELEDAQKRGLENESIVADPLFADPDNLDFTLSDDSPAFALGFRKYDWSKAGPRI